MRALKIGMFSVASMLLLFSSACTRPQGDNSKTNLTIPLSTGNGTQSVAAQSSTLNYVAINVTGPSLDPLFCSWDIESNRITGPCSFTQTPPTDTLPAQAQVALPDLLNGPSRVFQALMVFSQGSGSSMTFQYADDTKDLPQSQVTLQPKPVGGTQYGGHLSGRYLTGVNSGPSGLMNVRFSPGIGKPSMVVEQVEVYSGWFQAFTLETTGFDYVLNGENIFDKTMTKADFVLQSTASAYASRVDPSAPGVGEYNVFGFFSKTASNLEGKTSSLSPCSPGVAFTSCFSNDLKFAGPFRGNAIGDLLTVAGGLTPATISWALLPGVTSSDFADSVAVYTATTDFTADQLNKYVMSSGFNCTGFAKDSNVQLLGATTIDSTPQLVATLGAMPSPTRPLVVCPKKDVNLLTAAAVLPRLNNDGGCSNCKYLRLEVTSYAMSNGNKYTLGKNGCYPIQAKAFRGQGVPSSDHTHTISMTLSDPSWGHFYNDSQCASSVSTPTLNLSAGVNSSNESYWVRSASPGTNLVMAATISSDPTDGVITYQSQYNMLDIINPIIQVKMPTGPILTNTCYQGSVNVTMPNGFSIPVPASSTYDNIAANAGVGLAFDPATCATSISGTLTQMMGSSPVQSWFWFHTNTAGTVSVTAAPTSFDATFATATAISNANLVPIQIKLTAVSSPLLVNRCNEFLLEVVNANGYVIPAPNAININLSPIEGLGYWSGDASCMSSTNVVAIPVQSSGQSVYFYATSAGSMTGPFAPQFTTNVGATPLVPTTPTIVTPTDTSVPWIQIANRPHFPHGSGNQIGKHNFPVSVDLAFSGDVPLKCYKGPSPPPSNSTSWGDCLGRLTPVTAASAKISFDDIDLGPSPSETTHIMAMKGQQIAVLSLGKDRLFGTGSFNILPCAATVPAGSGFTTINAALVAHPTGVCLDAGSYAADTATSISMPVGAFLLGKIDPATGLPASVVTVPATNGGAGLMVPDLSGSVYISNIKFDMSGTTAGTRYGIYSSAGSNGTVYSFGNLFDGSSSTGGTTTGISVGTAASALTLDSTADLFKSKTFSGAGNSYGISLTPSGNTTNIRYDKFSYASATSGDGSIGLAIAAPVSGAASYVSVMNSEFSGDGGGIRALGQSAAGGNALELMIQQTFIQANATPFVSGYGVYIQDNVGTHLQESKIVNASPGKAGFKYYQGTAGGAYSGGTFMMLESNVIQQSAAAPAVDIGTASLDLAATRQITLDNNHFVKTGGGNANPAVQGSAATYQIYFVRNSGLPSHGLNKACGSGANLWSSFYGGTSSIASSVYMWSPPSASASVYSGLCEFVP